MAGPKLASLTIVFLLTTSALNWASPPSCTDDCAPFIPGAVAYWPMTSETNGSDLSGNENHAKFVGLTYTDGPTGEENGAVHFNGSSNSFASVTNSPSMQVGKYPGFSFSGFVRFGIHYKSASLIDWSSDDGNGVYIMALSQQTILIKLHPIHDTDYNHIAEFPTLKLNKSSWHFIGVSYDKATGRITAFIDGKEELKQLDENIVTGTYKTKQVGLGIDLSKQSDFSYKGDMSGMMLFKYALTSDDFNRVMEFCRTTQLTQTTLPNITVSDIAATRATASWNKSPGIFSRYKISLERRQIGLGQEFANSQFIPASVTFPKTVLTHLVPGATYRVRVWHMERDLVGRARSSAWFDTATYPVVETDSIIFTEITATSANVSWKDVTGNYGSYSVDISPTTGGAKADPSIVPRRMTTTSLMNLSPGSIYTITIRTKIGSATSSPSVQSFQTLDLPKDQPSSSSMASVIGLIVAAGLCSVVIVIVITCIVINRRRNGIKKGSDSPSEPNGADQPMLKNITPGLIRCVMANDLKKRYEKDYCSILPLPYRHDQKISITQLNRNFEWKTKSGRYGKVELEKIFEEHDNHKSNRYVLEALAGYGKSSAMKKLAYTWATVDKYLHGRFKFVFLISSKDFIEFQKAAIKNGTGNHLADYVSSDYFFSDQSIESGHNRLEIWRLVQDNEKKVLFIIDDTHYNSEEWPEDLHKLFLNTTMRDSTVILACRTNQVPAKIFDQNNKYTSLRITEHNPSRIKKSIVDYFGQKGAVQMGNALIRNLGIENMDDTAFQNDVKLSWLTSPLVHVIIMIAWQDICKTSKEDEKESLCLDEPYIYQMVVKNIFKYYECCEGGIPARVDYNAEGKTYAQETHTLGKLAWGLIEKNKLLIPADVGELGFLKVGVANVYRDIGVLKPFTSCADALPKENFVFTHEIWKFYFAARFLRNERHQGKKSDKDIQDAVEMVGNPNKNIEGLFTKIIDLPMTVTNEHSGTDVDIMEQCQASSEIRKFIGDDSQ